MATDFAYTPGTLIRGGDYKEALVPAEAPPDILFVEVLDDKESGEHVKFVTRADIEYFARHTTPRLVAEYKLVGKRTVQIPVTVKEVQ